MTDTRMTALTNNAVAAARDLPDLVNKLQAVAPGLADQLTPKALTQSKSFYVTPFVTVLTWASTKYGLGWDPHTCEVVAVVVLIGVNAAMRAISTSPIGSFFAAKPAA